MEISSNLVGFFCSLYLILKLLSRLVSASLSKFKVEASVRQQIKDPQETNKLKWIVDVILDSKAATSTLAEEYSKVKIKSL